MPLEHHDPERDLLYPLPPPGSRWHHHRVYTNYYGFTVPEHALGVFTYLRGQPAFPLSHGGVMIFQGLANQDPLDAEFFDYEISMPWPEIKESSGVTTVTTDNGLRFEILEPGRTIRLTYTSNDGATSIDVLAEAVTPMIARGHVMSGESDHEGGEREPGGFEQYMHYTGSLTLHGTRYPVDAHDVRDRSWHQLRTERQDAVLAPPMGWTPMRFGDGDGALTLHHVGFEAPDHAPLWTEVYDLPPEKVKPIAGWVYVAADGRALRIVRTRREVHDRHPVSFMPTRQTLEVEDETGRVRAFTGEALAAGHLPMWPNTTMRGAVYRWTDESGRTSHSLTQELWFDRWQRAMKQARALSR